MKRKKGSNANVLTLINNDEWEIFVPLDHMTSCKAGKHTSIPCFVNM